MVRFEKDRFIIEVKTGINPIENWLGTIQDLLSVLRAQDPDLANGEKHYFTFALLSCALSHHPLPGLLSATKSSRFQHLVYDAVLHRFLSRHEIISVRVSGNGFDGLPRVLA